MTTKTETKKLKSAKTIEDKLRADGACEIVGAIWNHMGEPTPASSKALYMASKKLACEHSINKLFLEWHHGEGKQYGVAELISVLKVALYDLSILNQKDPLYSPRCEKRAYDILSAFGVNEVAVAPKLAPMTKANFVKGQVVARIKDGSILKIDEIKFIPGTGWQCSIVYTQKQFPYQSGGGSFWYPQEDFTEGRSVEERLRIKVVQAEIDLKNAQAALNAIQRTHEQVVAVAISTGLYPKGGEIDG